MNVEVSVRIDGLEVACVKQELETGEALPLEEQTERLKDRLGQVLLEVGTQRLAASLNHPCCCGRRMRNHGLRSTTITSLSGEVTFVRNRYRCRKCGAWQTPADAVVCCGPHRITRLLARDVCQLATLEHFPRLEQLLADQHGVHLGHDPMLRLVHDVGGAAEAQRLAEVEFWRQQPAGERRWPQPEVTPERVYVSCDGIMYCTNETEPDPHNPQRQRLIWKQMRVGCVYWQDADEHWHKRVLWGQEEDFLSFGTSLYRLACRCGYRQAREKIFAADGGEWCWTIHQTYFADAAGVLDWYHASQHVWACGKALHSESQAARQWVDEALGQLRFQGGEGLLNWLLSERRARRGKKRKALDALINYVQPRLDRTDYPTYRNSGWKIGTGMIESTAKQLVALRLKGPGMHWSPHGATAITALRAQDLNGAWHTFWKNLALAA
jgi:hypothetical protein